MVKILKVGKGGGVRKARVFEVPAELIKQAKEKGAAYIAKDDEELKRKIAYTGKQKEIAKILWIVNRKLKKEYNLAIIWAVAEEDDGTVREAYYIVELDKLKQMLGKSEL